MTPETGREASKNEKPRIPPIGKRKKSEKGQRKVGKQETRRPGREKRVKRDSGKWENKNPAARKEKKE